MTNYTLQDALAIEKALFMQREGETTKKISSQFENGVVFILQVN